MKQISDLTRENNNFSGKRYRYTTGLLFLLLYITSYFTSAQIQPPSGWGDFKVGLVNDNSNIYNVRMKQAMNEGTVLNYRYAYINNGVDPSSNAISWLFSPWADYAKGSNDMGLRPAFVIYMLQEEGAASVLKSNIQNADFMRKYFNSIRIVAEKSKGYKAIFVVEPDTWGYFLQNALETNSESDPRKIPARVNDLGTGYEHLQGLPNTLSGVAQGIIRTIKKYAPDAYAGHLMSFWAVAANGKTGPPTSDGAKGMVYWNQGDVDYSAQRNAEFANQLLGTGPERGDFIGVEKNGWSAGNWLVKQNRNDYYWNDTQNAKWVSWSKTLSQQVNLPLLGWQISIGHIGLPNTVNRYEDTFMPYFFSHTQEFMNAGFIGFLVGKGLADCTDYTNINGNSQEANGNAGDNGWFFEKLKVFDNGRPYLGGSSNQAPVVSITSPTNNASYTQGATITINANASDPDGSITKVEFFYGGNKLGEDASSPYTFTWNNVTAGTYTLTAKATDNGGLSTTSAAVNITVNSGTNNPPSVSITSPANGTSYNAPASVTITASATDDGSISKVEFYNGTEKLGEDASSPYSFTWNNVAAGSYNITAKAIDNTNLSTVSTAISIIVNTISSGCNEPKYIAGTSYQTGAIVQNTSTDNKNKKYECKVGGWCSSSAAWAYEPGKGMYWTDAWKEVGECTGNSNNPPSVSITSPANGATYTAPATIAITASASDDGSVAKVEFYNGASKLGEDATAPYSFNWANVAAGSYSITAKATDNLGVSTTSVAINITVNQATNNPPSVSITSPANGATYTAPATISITASASDDGSVAKVEFYNGASKLGEDATAPYSFNWANVAAGSYSITAKATDNLGVSTNSVAVSITVNQATNNPPSVSITSPANGTTYTAPATLNISANASDDGSVAKVEFYNGASKLGEDATAPYSFNWANVAAGSYSLTAKATDNLGVSTTSAAVEITVNSSEGCSAPQYVENGGYKGADKVQVNGILYECKPFPYEGWCNGAAWAYGPGTGAYWSNAWNQLGSCPSTSMIIASSSVSKSEASVQVVNMPVNESIRLKISMPSSGYASINLINFSGWQNSLLETYLNAGEHELEFNTSDLSSGIYVLKCELNGVLETKTIVKQ